MYEIPISIELEGQSYPIREKGDYRMVLDCFRALNDLTIPLRERVYSSLIIFYEDIDSISDFNKFPDVTEAVRQMYIFFNCGNASFEETPKMPRLIDWVNDEQLICSAINKVAGQEVRAVPYLHWWTFMGYYLAIGESPLSHIVGIRSKIATHQKLEKYERKFQAENPQYFKMDFRSDEDKEYDELVKELWNKDT